MKRLPAVRATRPDPGGTRQVEPRGPNCTILDRTAMNDDWLTDWLAAKVLGWKTAPGRFVKPDRGWAPRWHFAPCSKIQDVFLLLERAGSHYTLRADRDRGFCAEVHVGGRIGKASGEQAARTISTALARALGLEVKS